MGFSQSRNKRSRIISARPATRKERKDVLPVFDLSILKTVQDAESF